jgi:hypothetical protein
MLFLLMAGTISALGSSAQTPIMTGGFAVIELFTSEGCSSCPPSDEVLSRIVQAADREHLPVYALEWHVDYWDYLGWKDPFDLHLATERQYAYSRALRSSVYTPQAILNGVIVPAYAGDFNEIDSITRSLAKGNSPIKISLQARASAPEARASASGSGGGAGGSTWKVHVVIDGAPAGAVLLLALVESGLEAKPTAGENAGRTLMHANVVRAVVLGPATSGDTVIKAVSGIEPAHSRIVGLLQDAKSLRIYAAAQAFLTAATGAAVPVFKRSTVEGARISGRVVDGSGRGLAGVALQACSGALCIPGVTDERGFFSIPGATPGIYTLKAGSGGSYARVIEVDRQDVSLSQPIELAR